METGALNWCSEVAGVRSHRSLEGASPLSVFRTLELEKMLALPTAVFELASWSRPKVGTDCHAKVGRTLYTVPWRNIGRQLDAREGDHTVEFYLDGVIIKTWARKDKGRQTDWAGVAELAQVVADHVEGPLALRTGETAQAELPGVLADLHLSEDRLDDRLSARVVGTALLRPQPAGHRLASRRVLRDRAAWCLLELLAAALASGRTRTSGLGPRPLRGCPPSSSRHRRGASRGAVDAGFGEVLLGLFDHRDELVDVAGLVGDLSGEHDLALSRRPQPGR
jgi:hypothetical protein